MNGAITLCYHDLFDSNGADSSGFPGLDSATYKLFEKSFRVHVRAIANLGSPGQGGDASASSRRDVLMTFDDGGISSLRIADILEENGLRGYFFIPTDYIGKAGFVGKNDIRDLRRRGHVIGSHSCSHRGRMSHMPITMLRGEWGQSVAILSDLIHERVATASVPSGYYAPRVAEAAAAEGVQLLFTLEPTARLETIAGCAIMGRYLMRRNTAAAEAAAIAAGSPWPRFRQRAYWTLKKVAKMSPIYTRFRRIYFQYSRA